MSTRMRSSFGVAAELGGLVVALALASALPACDGDARPSEVDTTGAVEGELETFVVDYEDGSSERQHFLALGDRANTRLRLLFDGEPELSSTTRLRVWGGGDPDSSRRALPAHVDSRGDVTAISSAGRAPKDALGRVRCASILGGGVNITAAAAQPLVFARTSRTSTTRRSYGTLKFSGAIIGPISYAMDGCANAATTMLATTLRR